MSLSSYMVERLDDLQAQWSRSLLTLPAKELAAQREALRAACEGRGSVSPASLVLALLDGEIARREGPRG